MSNKSSVSVGINPSIERRFTSCSRHSCLGAVSNDWLGHVNSKLHRTQVQLSFAAIVARQA
jgi:hypothetical protein